jgi:hypothetical protein
LLIEFFSKSIHPSLRDTTTPTLTATNQPNALEIRFLLFVEDADGIRSNIFDSSKYQAKSHGAQQSSALKATSNGSLPISSPAFNKNNSLNVGNAKLLAGSSNSSGSLNKQENLNNEMLTRMVFGSSPMVVSNRTAIKVHSLK